MPSVYQITNAVSAEEWHLHTDGSFLPGRNPNPLIPDTVTPIVKEFLAKLADCAADYLAELALLCSRATSFGFITERQTYGTTPNY